MAAPCRPGSRSEFKIAIICALPLEFDAVCLALDTVWDQDGYTYGKSTSDPNTYATGCINSHNVVLALLPHIGKVGAAVCAGHLRSSYQNIQVVILAGICGAVPRDSKGNEIILGDVIIANRVVQYDFGRQYPHGFVAKHRASDVLGRPSREILSLLNMLETEFERSPIQLKAAQFLAQIQQAAVRHGHQTDYADPGPHEDRLFESLYIHKHIHSPLCICAREDHICEDAVRASCNKLGCDQRRLVNRKRLVRDNAARHRIHVGIVASADSVMKSGEERDRIAWEYGAIAFEMEGAGLWDDTPCILIKGACDFADSHKNKNWQPFAAARAAATVKALLSRYAAFGNLSSMHNHKGSGQTAPGASFGQAQAIHGTLTEDSPLVSLPASAQLDGNEEVDENPVEDSDRSDQSASERFRELVALTPMKRQSKVLMDRLLHADWEAHKDRNPPAAKGTCKWILEHTVYCEWLQSTESRLLWISADPGCGKSVLASYLIDNHMGASDSTRANMCYFFFKSDNTEQTRSVTALHSILCQLFMHYPGLFARYGVNEIDKKFGDVPALWKAFSRVVQEVPSLGQSRTASPCTFVVLDGLDECREADRKELVRLLSTTFKYLETLGPKNETGGLFKILILSRPNNAIAAAFDKTRTTQDMDETAPEAEGAEVDKNNIARSSMIRLRGEDETDSISADISRMVDAHVAELVDQGLSGGLLAESDIPSRLKSRADRTFLWVKLVIPLLAEKVETGASRRQLDSILDSRDVYAVYSELLALCKNTEMTRKMLSIILAAERPLSTTEMSIALAVTPDHDLIQLKANPGSLRTNRKTFVDLEYDMVYPFEVNVRSVCGNFVRIIQNRIYLVHETAKEFLLNPNDSAYHPMTHAQARPTNQWEHSMYQKNCHAMILQICTAYLYLLGKESPLSPRGLPSRRAKGFLKYAGRYWATHFGQVRDLIYESTNDIRYYENLCHPLFPGFEAWTGALAGSDAIRGGHSKADLQDLLLDKLKITNPYEEMYNPVADMPNFRRRDDDDNTAGGRGQGRDIADEMAASANPTSLRQDYFPGLGVDETGFVRLQAFGSIASNSTTTSPVTTPLSTPPPGSVRSSARSSRAPSYVSSPASRRTTRGQSQQQQKQWGKTLWIRYGKPKRQGE